MNDSVNDGLNHSLNDSLNPSVNPRQHDSANHHRTVVGWDGGDAAADAVAWAVERERGRHGTIALVRVVADHHHSSNYAAVQSAIEAAQLELTAEATRLGKLAPECFITTTVVHGDPLDELIGQANPGWVLAVGAAKRHRSPFGHGSSLAAQIAAAANGPVAIIPPAIIPPAVNSPATNSPNTGTAGSRRRTGVVVGVDGSAESLRAVDVAIAEAVRRQEELILIHAWQEPTALAEEYTIDPRLVEAVEEQGERILAAATTSIFERYPELRVRAQLVGGAAEIALREAATTAALVVVGTRHLRGLKRILLGSVSHYVVQHLQCPTIVVGHGSAESGSDGSSSEQSGSEQQSGGQR
ncbi:nucleotide-binding universal stress UspA family protein [Glaciihabitans tibetensis]|uniref:Nucleotide-binding universal stress UspA family protein n=1 Tax=Glaciihabitans tibetensis TaxID=1266600 RepID=A0A2T0VK58_9MICO|nr:universal stress protein [Glaciihabitans tibetensis]PRY70584.1 nucleotide-binding universal stress UspA family protein [Glaciihabitans tibetensis]